jgi:hypothetical protein
VPKLQSIYVRRLVILVIFISVQEFPAWTKSIKATPSLEVLGSITAQFHFCSNLHHDLFRCPHCFRRASYILHVFITRADHMQAFFNNAIALGPTAVNLNSAINYVILAQAGISTVPQSAIS